MMFFKAALLVITALAILPAVGQCSLSVTVSCGNGISDSRSTVSYGDETISTSQKLVVNPSTGGMINYAAFQGSLPGASYGYTDSQGNHVDL